MGLTVALLIALADLVVAPLHRAGHIQGMGGFYVGAVHLLNLPGHTIAGVFGLWERHRWTWQGFAMAMPISTAFWMVVTGAVVQFQRPRPQEPVAGRGISRR